MDNLTHTLAGALLARAGLGKISRRATAALLISSNLPDADSLALFYGELFYLEHHRGVTHSLAGVLALSFLLAALLSLEVSRPENTERARKLHRPWAAGGHGAPGPASQRDRPLRPAALLALSVLGLSLHLVMDYTNSYGVRPFLPWDGKWFYGDLVFIIDPWLWLLLGGSLFVGSRGGILRMASWSLVSVAASAAVLTGAASLDRGIARIAVPLWFGGLAATVLARRWLRPQPERLARRALAGVFIYWMFLAADHQLVLRQLRAEAARLAFPGEPRALAALPAPAVPFRWVPLIETADQLILGDEGNGWVELKKNLDHPAVLAARGSCAGAALFRFFRFPVAEVERSPGGYAVVLRDVRYRRRGRSGFGAATLSLTPELSPVPPPEPCPAPAAWISSLANSLAEQDVHPKILAAARGGALSAPAAAKRKRERAAVSGRGARRCEAAGESHQRWRRRPLPVHAPSSTVRVASVRNTLDPKVV